MISRHLISRSSALTAAIAGLLALGLSACTSTAGPPPSSEAGRPYRIGPPDQLVITILPAPEIQRAVTVRPDGMISIDLVGDIPAAGRTPDEVANDIEGRISRYKRDAVVTVALTQSLSTEITVLGEVGRPSTFPLNRETRLVEAIGMVGGPRAYAAKDKIRIIRFVDGQTKIYLTDLDAIEKGDLSTNYLLQGGDVIVVPPTRLARLGYAIQSVLFPFQKIFGFGGSITRVMVTGGTM
ncbi:MAG: polysaccharide biosynthesis/export family protein [Deltaproteobacteria bacterium]|nr:polysaccharide biosynthesis/export family protein [Deltaproteobacteria bacterium]MBW2395170.1 polysaccharide biosynthesis/export family protein [Deltaproteobacteria bacterium]